ncbi:MAG TPA: deoxyribodipyrimidine photolyase [Desulfobacterales bacterium]|nr:deoxyribodipyrimidine photolyase [Desulfobacterales bacterium]
MNAHDLQRARVLNQGSYGGGPVVCWLSRDQRADDNWTLLYAQHLALSRQAALAVVFNLVPHFLQATYRQYDFMLKGLEELTQNLAQKNIPFFLLQGEPAATIPMFLAQSRAGAVVSDFDPLRIKRQWKDQVLPRLSIPFYEVDAHNIIPCWLVSAKQEFGAYTLRPRIHRLLSDFLTEPRSIEIHPFRWPDSVPQIDWRSVLASAAMDRSVPPVSWCQPGESAGRARLTSFIQLGLPRYHLSRNDPIREGQSDLSPYLHFGQIAAQRVAWEVQRAVAPTEARQAFLEELIVRRELADNFCWHNPDYDRFSGFPAWAQETLNKHRTDRRDYLYSLREFESARTHDPLWNAAQLEMLHRGKMHGYLRMYWAKKILEWTASPEEALEIALYLNNRYELDGRDPNGYAGVAWSIGGLHDRPWGERPVFGKIRFMSFSGCKRKFEVKTYIARMELWAQMRDTEGLDVN